MALCSQHMVGKVEYVTCRNIEMMIFPLGPTAISVETNITFWSKGLEWVISVCAKNELAVFNAPKV